MTKRTVLKCSCGNRKSKYALFCKKCTDERDAARKVESQRVWTLGVCPKCGAKLKRNLALTGWIQCEQYGADTHRANPSKPACSYQAFV